MGNTPTIEEVQQALTAAGVEIYQTGEQDLRIAERVRLHIMNSGVRVIADGALRVQFTARTQQSDGPSAESAELFQKVREHIGASATARGYGESRAESVMVKDPVDESKVLDVWHEVTYEKALSKADEAVEEVRWALALEKYVRL